MHRRAHIEKFCVLSVDGCPQLRQEDDLWFGRDSRARAQKMSAERPRKIAPRAAEFGPYVALVRHNSGLRLDGHPQSRPAFREAFGENFPKSRQNKKHREYMRRFLIIYI